MNSIIERRRGLMNLMGASDVVTGTVTVETGNKITIPKADGKTKMAFFLEGDAELLVNGRSTGCFILPYISTDKVYYMKLSNVAQTPPVLTIGSTNFTETTSALTMTFGNGNTVGWAPVGYTVRYFWW